MAPNDEDGMAAAMELARHQLDDSCGPPSAPHTPLEISVTD